MDVALITAGWEQLYNRYYRKKELYQMQWVEESIDLKKFSCYAAPFGGPVALVLDESKFVKVSAGLTPSDVLIYTSSGARLSRFSIKKSLGRLVTLGWTDEEELIVVLDDGVVYMYSVFGELLKEFSMGGSCTKDGIAECQIYPTGMVALTNAYDFVWIASFFEPRPRLLASAGLNAIPTAWAVVEPRYSLSTSVEVLVATGTGTIIVLDGESAQDQLLSNGPFDQIAIAPGGKIVACFSGETGELWVVSIDFQNSITTFDTKSKRVPKQVAWCGTDSVLMAWDELLLMVGPQGDWIKYAYDEPAYLAPESDGVRVFSNSLCEFIERVPDATEQIFKIGSTSPAAMLFDAADHFQRTSPKADELIRAVGADLADAVDACIEAAGHEWSHGAQRALLRAAAFGKAFLDLYDSDKFVRMCKELRVLNAMRHFEVGMPMTHAQLQIVTARGALARLSQHKQHLLAARIAKYLGLRADDVLIHWACCKVTHDDDDHTVAQDIVEKLTSAPGISYVKVASTAYRIGKPQLATLLLEHEPHAADQVPLLIGMKEDDLALRKAIASGDTDLVYLVLLHIKRTRAPAEFFAMLRDKPVAMDLLIAYCKQQDLALLKDIYYAANKPHESAHIAVREAYEHQDITKRVAGLQIALEVYKVSKDNFHASATEDQIRLLLLQRELEAETGREFVGTSLGDTLYQCVSLGQSKRASKLAKEFKVPDKRFWHVRVSAAAAARDWGLLAQIAKEKKSPIGYEPFAEVCIEAGAPNEAKKYIPKIGDAQTRVETFIRIKAFAEAATVAREMKDLDLLNHISSMCPNDRQTQAHIQSLVQQLTK